MAIAAFLKRGYKMFFFSWANLKCLSTNTAIGFTNATIFNLSMKSSTFQVSCIVLARSRQNMRNKNKEDLAESTSVVPTKYPPKVKVRENFYNSRVLELGKLHVP